MSVDVKPVVAKDGELDTLGKRPAATLWKPESSVVSVNAKTVVAESEEQKLLSKEAAPICEALTLNMNVMTEVCENEAQECLTNTAAARQEEQEALKSLSQDCLITATLDSNEPEALKSLSQDCFITTTLDSNEPGAAVLLSLHQLTKSIGLTENCLLNSAVNAQNPNSPMIVHIHEGQAEPARMTIDGKLEPVKTVTQFAPTMIPPSYFPRPLVAAKHDRARMKQKHKRHKSKKSKKHRLKKWLVLDKVKELTGECFKSQLQDTSDIVTSLELAPPTKKVMEWTSSIDAESLFECPGRTQPNKILLDVFTDRAHIASKAVNVTRYKPTALHDEDEDMFNLNIVTMALD